MDRDLRLKNAQKRSQNVAKRAVSGRKYQIIYADPPWSYSDKSLNRGGAERHYATMSNAQICDLPVPSISDANCALLMWATFPKIQEALDVIKSWGFIYKTCAFVWVKTNRRTELNQSSFFPEDNFASFWGMGSWTRSNAEICLFAVKGKPRRYAADVHQIIFSPIGRHSTKPLEAYARILRLLGDLPRIELFCREAQPGWAVWGNEVQSTEVLA